MEVYLYALISSVATESMRTCDRRIVTSQPDDTLRILYTFPSILPENRWSCSDIHSNFYLFIDF